MKSVLARHLAALCFACAGFAQAAPLDLAPDAVLGKPDYTTSGVGAASSTNIQMPMGLAEDPVSGELWVADHFASRVLRFASARAFTNGEAANLVLGQADFTASAANRGGAVAANTLNRPRGLAVDQARRLYVSDSDNHRVLVYAPPFANGMDAGIVVGQSGFTTNAPDLGGASPTHIGLRAPHGLAVDDEGRLWVADAGNARVLRYGAPLDSFAGAMDVKGQPDFLSRTPVLSASGMGFPVGMNVDRDGHLWVVDRGFHRVTRHHRDSLRTDGAPADWVICQPDFTTALAGVTATNCNFPEAVVVDREQTYAYIADAGNSRVLRVFSKTADAWIGQAAPTDQLCNRNAPAPSADTLCQPFALAFDRLGNLLVADGANGRVLRYDQPSERVTPVPEEASPSAISHDAGDVNVTIRGLRFYGDTTAMLNGQPVPTRHLARDRLVATLPAAALAGSGALDLGLQTPGAVVGTIQPPITLARYARTPGDRLADRVLGQPDFEMDSSSNSSVGEALVGTTTAANLEGDGQVAIDPVSGRVFLSQAYARRVLSWPSHADLRNGQAADVIIGQRDFFEGSDTDVSARSLGQAFNGLAIDRAGRLYVADQQRHRVLRFDPPFSTDMAAARVFGQGGSFTSDTKNLGGRSGASLAYPGAVAADANRLFVFDSENRRILVYENPDADTTADAAIGQADLVSAVQLPASATRIGGSSPGLALDGSGRLYFTDYDANRVLRFSPPFSSGMAADLVIGQPDFTTRAPGTSDRNLDRPAGLAIDAAGHLLVADQSNNRIIRFAAPLASGQAARGLLGQAGYMNAGDGTGRDGLNNPMSVAVDEGGNVLVHDRGNSRLLAYDRPFGRLSPSRTVNLSTRMAVLAGENVLIGGFVIEGTAPKRIVIRARGPSLAGFGIPNALANPLLQLFSGATEIAANDDWRLAANAADIQASGFAPSNDREAAILATLAPGAYTAIVSGVGGVTGVGIVEVFEVDSPATPLVNIATRGPVLTGGDVMIAGFVIQGTSPQTVVVRARGPSLAQAGIAQPLANPQLQLFAGPTQIAANDDWTVSGNAAAIQASGFAPPHPREAAILVTLQPGAYTAIVSGVGGTTGVGIVEVFVP